MKILNSSLLMGLVAMVAAGGCTQSVGNSPCVSLTCPEMGTNCGQVVDNCGVVVECGACLEGSTCGAAGPNVCGVGTCAPLDCVVNGLCGVVANGCGALIDCGACASGTGGTGAIGTGGTAGTGATVGTGGAPASGGAAPVCSYGTTVAASPTLLGGAAQAPSGSTSEQYKVIDVTRAGKPYKIMTNGWGPGWQGHTIGWSGTAMSTTLSGQRGGSGEPAGFPAVFCGKYSDQNAIGCGLPTSLSTSVKTGMRWKANGNKNNYNVAWDIWLGDGNNLQSYLMVWLHYPGGTQSGNPRGESPAGKRAWSCVQVDGVPGSWDIFAGQVTVKNVSRPIVNYVRPQGSDVTELEFDVKSFYNDAMTRGANPAFPANWATLQGSQINSVAVGFEIWNSTNGTGPLQIEDFYVNVN